MIAVLGARGWVGSRFVAGLQERGLEHTALSRERLGNRWGRNQLREALREIGAEFLVNAAGYTGRPNVDACEDHKTACLEGNAVLPGMIREVCEELGIAWGHVSSGCIYSGERPGGGGWREDDAPNFTFRRPPCSFYSGCKALGEEVLGYQEAARPASDWPAWLPQSAPTGYVWRLRIPFCEQDGPRNYLSKLQRYERLLQARNSLSHLDDFVDACLQCWEKRVPFGIYNVTNPGAVTTSQVVEMIRDSGVCRKEYRFFASEEEFMAKAARAPRSNCVLDTAKLASVGIQMRPVEEALEWSLRNWKREVAV